ASAGWLINGVSLSVDGSLTQGTGNNGYSVYEYIGTDSADVESQVPSIAELLAEQTWTADASGAFGLDGALQAQTFFGPRSEIFVGKNLLVFSTDSNDEASLTAFTQRFSQVQRSIPEPSSLMLLGIGLLGFFAPKLRKSSRHA
ncbi:MAG: PEP-CTERM sorting domain-containing protein, partial [Gammaproteobacteria bacterium]